MEVARKKDDVYDEADLAAALRSLLRKKELDDTRVAELELAVAARPQHGCIWQYLESGWRGWRSFEATGDDEMRQAYMKYLWRGSLDGDLGRLCRGGSIIDVAVAGSSDSDEELCGLGAMSGQQSLARRSDRLPRSTLDEQQRGRSMDSESEDSQDAEMDAN